MTLFEIKDHEHTTTRTERNEYAKSIVEIYDCQTSECDYRKWEFTDVTQTALGAFE